jgi:isopenicillin-N epimerase
MLAALVAMPLSPHTPTTTDSSWAIDPLGEALFSQHRIEIPVFPFPAPPHRLVRIACQVYVERDDVERLCAALVELGEGRA